MSSVGGPTEIEAKVKLHKRTLLTLFGKIFASVTVKVAPSISVPQNNILVNKTKIRHSLSFAFQGGGT